jgi:acetyl-CoA acetyltransferase
MHDTTIGWRFVNPRMEELYGVDAMGETAENVAQEHGISRADQDAFALRSQQRAGRCAGGRLAVRGDHPGRRPRRAQGRDRATRDEHPRAETTLESLARLKPAFRSGGTVTAGNASGVNDGAAACSSPAKAAPRVHGLTPAARILGVRHRRRRAAGDGHRPGAGGAASCWNRRVCRSATSTWSS